MGSAGLLGLQQVLVRIGMRRRPLDDGHFMSVLVNVAVLMVVVVAISLPAWDWSAMLAFVLAGVLTTLLGRGLSFRAIRRMGPARVSTVLIAAPLFAAGTGWVLLDERVTLLTGVGGLVVLTGLAILARSRVAVESLMPEDEASAQGMANPVATRPTLPERSRHGTLSRLVQAVVRGDPRHMGIAQALLAAGFFGVGFVVRKWGVTRYPSPVAGALVGATTSLVALVIASLLRRQLPRLLRDNFRDVPWWFVLSGVASSGGLIMQFAAFLYVPAWMVSLFQGTGAMWTLLWSYLLIRGEERIATALIVSVVLVMAGVGIMTLQM